MNKRINEPIKEYMTQWTNESMKQWTHETLIKQWTDNQWINAPLNHNEPRNQRINESKSQ